MFDLVSLGEILLRLSPPKFQRLRQAATMEVWTGGAQLNVAANLARLGKRTAFVTSLPDNELGWLARDRIARYGVDTSLIQFVPNARMGMVYVDFSATPRVSTSIFDRLQSAASKITRGDFDWGTILDGVKLAHTDGIFPGLSSNCAEVTLDFVQTARALGVTTTFDINYREHLWSREAARESFTQILPHITILATNRDVSEQIFSFSGTDADLLRQYRETFGNEIVCLTSREISSVLHGAWTSQALVGDEILHGRRFEFEVIDRFGTGDAWFAGFLYGYIFGNRQDRLPGDLQYGLDFGDALCAIGHTIEGDVTESSVAEVNALLQGSDLRIKR